MGGDDFCLKWNDHHTTFFNSAEQLCRGETLTDVILSCGGREFFAHRLVLSVCSSYFHGLFSQRRSHLAGESIVYLKDVDPRHMELLLSYMYRGEINVQESDLYSLLTTAKGLQIRGLTEAVAPTATFNLAGQFVPQQQQPQVLGKPVNNVNRVAPAAAATAGTGTAQSAMQQISAGHHDSLMTSNILSPPISTANHKRLSAAAGAISVGQVVGHHIGSPSTLAVLPTVPAPLTNEPQHKRIKTELRNEHAASGNTTILTQAITEPTSFLVQTNHQTAPADLTASAATAGTTATTSGFQQESANFQGGSDNFLEPSDFATLHDTAGSSGILYDDQPGSLSSPKRTTVTSGTTIQMPAASALTTVSGSSRRVPSLPTVPLSTHALAATTSSAATAAVVGGETQATPASGSSAGGDMHTCSFCMRQFKYHMRLIEHMRTHTKERPFECKFCGKHFTQKGSCSRHERTCPKEKQNQQQQAAAAAQQAASQAQIVMQ